MLTGAGVPGSVNSCPGRECCGFLADSEDPCRGCAYRDSGPGGGFAASYALFLAGYIETFRPHPAEVGWRDYEIYQAFLQARQEYLAEQQREAVRKAGGGIHGRRRT